MQEQRITNIIWRGKSLILLSLVLSAALAVFVTQHSKKVYAASAILEVLAPGGGNDQRIDPLQQLQANETLATTYATLIGDRSFLEKIRPQVEGGAYTVSELQGRLSAKPVKDTALIKITAEERSPDVARA